MNKISGFLLLIAALIVPSIAFADLAQHKRTCSSIGFTAGTEPHGDCVLRLVKIETGVRDEALETDSRSEEYLQQQAEDLRYLRRQAERQEQNAKLDTMLNLLAPLTGGAIPLHRPLTRSTLTIVKISQIRGGFGKHAATASLGRLHLTRFSRINSAH